MAEAKNDQRRVALITGITGQVRKLKENSVTPHEQYEGSGAWPCLQLKNDRTSVLNVVTLSKENTRLIHNFTVTMCTKNRGAKRLFRLK